MSDTKILTTEVKKSIDRSVLCWLATASKDGAPNVSPKEIFVAEDDAHLSIAHIASSGSVQNIRSNPNVCVSFIDVFVQKGYKLKSHATLITETDLAFAARAAPLKKKAGEAFKVRAVIAVEIREVQPILALSYRFYPNTAEQSQTEEALVTYRVQTRSE